MNWRGIALLTTVALPCAAQQMSVAVVPLKNTSFETPAVADGYDLHSRPEGWSCFASKPGEVIGVTTQAWRNGSQSLIFRAVADNQAFEGAGQEFAVVPGYRYGFTTYVMGDPANRLFGNAYGQIHLEWRNAENNEIGRTYGPTWTAGLSSKRWERYYVEGEAPAKAVKGIAVITFYTKDFGGRGAFFVDDCEFTGFPSRTASPTPSDRARRPPRP